MLRKPESKLWQLIKKNTPSIVWNRIETSTVMGFPDLIGCHANCGLFSVELKVSNRNKIKLSPHQIAWNYSHSLKGGKCFIIATPLEQSTLNIYGGIMARELSLNATEVEPLAVFRKPFDWEEVVAFLTQN
jgi:Holliday junction resolvase|tara:strand:- start:606 stop:998 length:393 start_codon:yes stop_codon:yes gene_type:complete